MRVTVCRHMILSYDDKLWLAYQNIQTATLGQNKIYVCFRSPDRPKISADPKHFI